MYRLPLLFLTLLCTCVLAESSAQTTPKALIGAWESSFLLPDGGRGKLSMTIADDYMSMVAYRPKAGEFLSTLGGRYRADTRTFSVTLDYDSSDSTQVGGVLAIPYTLTGRILMFNGDKVWTRVDDGKKPGALAGAWQIVGRKRDGVMQDMSGRLDGSRKTIKILSGKRFQWIAFDVDSRRMIATGGGTYTTNKDGLYREKIEFFSKDPEKVGRMLSFDYSLRDGDWVHRGQSTTGKPVHEVWRKR